METGASNPKHNKKAKSGKGIWSELEPRLKKERERSRSQRSRTTRKGEYSSSNLKNVASTESEAGQTETAHRGQPGRL